MKSFLTLPRFYLLVLSLAGCMICPRLLWAADNTATGSIGGTTGTLQPSATISLEVKALELVKEVRSSTGQPLARDTAAGQGSVLWFVIWVHNDLSTALEDIQLEDVVSSGPGQFTVLSLAPGVHAQAIDLSGVNSGEATAAITGAWETSWQDVTDVSGDHSGTPASGEYDSGTQTFRFGTSGTLTTIPANTLRAYRLKVMVN